MSYQHKYVDGTNIHFPVGKVVCIGRNYAEHAKELDNPVPTEPLLFIKRAVAWCRWKAVSLFPQNVVRCTTRRKSRC